MLNWKRAIPAAIIFYAVVFLVASVLMFSVGLTGDVFGAAMVVTGAVLITLLSKYYYFKGAVVKPVDGLLFGLLVAVVSALADIPMLVYGFAADQGWAYFATWHVLLGYALVILIPAVLAYMKK